jgi:hypothetical protein
MILINGHEAKIRGISKNIKYNTKSLEKKNLNDLIQLACKIAAPKDVLKEVWNETGGAMSIPGPLWRAKLNCASAMFGDVGVLRSHWIARQYCFPGPFMRLL